MLPDPVWPVLLLAAIQAFDAVACTLRLPFVVTCFEAIRFPREHWWIFPPIKLGAAITLVIGLWVPFVAAWATFLLVVYFLFAIGFHVRVRDTSPRALAPAIGMLALTVAVGVLSFVA